VLDVPEVRDADEGRATAALRAVLRAYGISFDDAAILRECKVDDEGASIDDLEDVAVKYGLEAGSVIVPLEHVLLPEARMLPAVVVVDAPEEEQDFVVVWRLDGDRVQVMDPREGRSWVARADLQKRLHVHEMAMPLDEYREAMAQPAFGDAILARARALGVPAEVARSLLDKASADPGWRGLGALDAAIRRVAVAPAPDVGGDAGASPAALLPVTFACAFERRCEGTAPVAPALWSVQPAPNGPQGEAQVKVRGAVLLAVAGRAAPTPAPAPSP
jgi:predicted double-glycine peptidase